MRSYQKHVWRDLPAREWVLVCSDEALAAELRNLFDFRVPWFQIVIGGMLVRLGELDASVVIEELHHQSEDALTYKCRLGCTNADVNGDKLIEIYNRCGKVLPQDEVAEVVALLHRREDLECFRELIRLYQSQHPIYALADAIGGLEAHCKVLDEVGRAFIGKIQRFEDALSEHRLLRAMTALEKRGDYRPAGDPPWWLAPLFWIRGIEE